MPSRFLAELRFFVAAAACSSSDVWTPAPAPIDATDRREWLRVCTASCTRFSRDTCRLWPPPCSTTTELRLDEGTDEPPPPLPVADAAADDDAVEALGVGGSGEFACRFSGFGEPSWPTELVHDDDDAWRECTTMAAVPRPATLWSTWW